MYSSSFTEEKNPGIPIWSRGGAVRADGKAPATGSVAREGGGGCALVVGGGGRAMGGAAAGGIR